MTVKDLQDVTKCKIYIVYTDGDGVIRMAKYTGGAPGRQISKIDISRTNLDGYVMAIELEDQYE